MAGFQLTEAEKIALTRKRLGETQGQFATRFNLQALAVTKWENGEASPKKSEHRAILTRLFETVLQEEDESQFETAAYQLNLPFDAPVRIDFRVSPLDTDRVRLGVQVMRKVG
jgi:transcriptional regulator with XRE-family HTH domain